jgi:hypothetical protein
MWGDDTLSIQLSGYLPYLLSNHDVRRYERQGHTSREYLVRHHSLATFSLTHSRIPAARHRQTAALQSHKKPLFLNPANLFENGRKSKTLTQQRKSNSQSSYICATSTQISHK